MMSVAMEHNLIDQNGIKIEVGQTLRFYNYDGCIWEGEVTFEDGMFTVSILNAKQIQNPPKWDREHDWIASRSWACQVGYGEYGTWNVPRRPLTEIAEMWRDYETELKPLQEKHGWAKRILKAEVQSDQPSRESDNA